MFRLKQFQIEDLSRAALHDGAILAWATGIGKSLAAVLFPLLKVGVNWEQSKRTRGLVPLKPCLAIAPENLHDQLAAEWERRFGIKTLRLTSQECYHDTVRKHGGRLKPAFYLSSYTQMGMNKIKKMPVPGSCVRTFQEVAKLMHFYGVTLDDAREHDLEADAFIPEGSAILLEKAIRVCEHRYKNYSAGVGEEKNGVKCIFGPSLADECGHEFECVVIDEGTRIKGEDTIIGLAIRGLDPRYRLVLTATPVKNRLKDLFFLIVWAAGGGDKPTARCPYTNDDQMKFVREFNVCERNLSQEQREAAAKGKIPGALNVRTSKKGRKKGRGQPGVQICNIHRLWKFLAPLILRRRKEDIGEDIVAKRKHIIRTPMGKEQHAVYRYHLLANYVDQNGKQAFMAKLQALRSAAAAPNSELLKEVEGCANTGPWRSKSDYIPKLAACLRVLEQRMRAGEQSVVFSALHEPLDTLSRRLDEAGVPHDVLDGRRSSRSRGELAAKFKLGLPKAKPILLAGLKAMAEGNNWPLANNVILLAFDWAYDLFEQGINRCHRLDSIRDVNIWPIVTDGTVDRKLESGIEEKGDAAELVLDGKLQDEEVKELNLYELLEVAVSEFRHATVMPEEQLESEWPELKKKLASAWQMCSRGDAGEAPVAAKTLPRTNDLPTLLKRVQQMQFSCL